MAGGLTEGCVARIEGLAVMASTALLDGQGRLYGWLCPLGGQGWPLAQLGSCLAGRSRDVQERTLGDGDVEQDREREQPVARTVVTGSEVC